MTSLGRMMLHRIIRPTTRAWPSSSDLSKKQVIGNVKDFRRLMPMLYSTTNEKSEEGEDSQRPGVNEDTEQLLIEKDKIIAEKEKGMADFKDRYLRALAENENIKARNKKLVDDTKMYGIQSFAKDLLEVADILEKATESVPKEELSRNTHLKDLYEGLKMTEVQLQKVFKAHSMEKINPVDEKFDPNFHEALFMQPSPGKESGTVAVVTKIGYKLHGRPLRAALVGVVQ